VGINGKAKDGQLCSRPPFRSTGKTIQLGHFNNVTQFRRILISRGWIFRAKQASRDPERLHLFPNPHQFLLFGAENIIRIFHRGSPRTRIPDFLPLKIL
jgi:hypothetical protein